jgi:hypothetical protein
MNRSKLGLILAGFLLAAGMGSASVLDSFGVISGEASVEPAVEILEVNADTSVNNNGGEYILIENNLGVISPVDWQVNQSDTAVQELNEVSDDSISSTKFALADKEAEFSNHGGIKIYELDDVLAGIPAGGDRLYLKYSDTDAIIQEFEYGDCDVGKAYVIEEGCKDASIEVSSQ